MARADSGPQIPGSRPNEFSPHPVPETQVCLPKHEHPLYALCRFPRVYFRLSEAHVSPIQ